MDTVHKCKSHLDIVLTAKQHSAMHRCPIQYRLMANLVYKAMYKAWITISSYTPVSINSKVDF